LKAKKVYLFVSSVLFVFWYHSPNFLDTPRKSLSTEGLGCTSNTKCLFTYIDIKCSPFLVCGTSSWCFPSMLVTSSMHAFLQSRLLKQACGEYMNT
jgi:hypothetical protein